ncbi:MAG: RidA family protein [Planctomycetaceae bacterium]|nr:RidA family protein [Planctomycetaceae bacterium]
MHTIRRIGEAKRYADIAIYRGTAHWVEIAETSSLDARGQISQVLAQIDATLVSLGTNRTALIKILVYLANLNDAAILNELWDAWVPVGQAPVRACVQAGLAGGYRVEMVISAAVAD